MTQRRSADGPFAASWARAREIQQEAHADATVASLRAAAIRSVVLYRDPATKAVFCLADSPLVSPTVLAARECESPVSAPSTASDIWPESVANDTPGDAPSGCLLVRRLQLLSPRSAGVSSSPAVVQSRALAILGGKHASPIPIGLNLNSARTVSTGLAVTPLDDAKDGYAASAVDNSAADVEVCDEAAAAVAGRAAAASKPPGSASLAAQHTRSVTLARPPTRGRQASQMLAATVEAVSSAVQTAEAAVRAAAASRSRSHSLSRSATPSRSRSGSRNRGRPVAAGAGAGGRSSRDAGVRDADSDAGGGPQANAGNFPVAVGFPHAIGSASLQPASVSSRCCGGATGATWERVEPTFMRPADGDSAPALPPLPSSTRSSTSNIHGAEQLQPQPPAYSEMPHAAAADLSASGSACGSSSHDGPQAAPESRGASACAPAAPATFSAAGHAHAPDCHVCRAENPHVALALDSCARGGCGGEAQPCDSAPPLLRSARCGWCACADSEDRGAASGHHVPPRVIASPLPLPQLGYFPSVHVSVGYGAAPAAATWSYPISGTALPQAAASHPHASAGCNATLVRSRGCCDRALKSLLCDGAQPVAGAARNRSSSMIASCRDSGSGEIAHSPSQPEPRCATDYGALHGAASHDSGGIGTCGRACGRVGQGAVSRAAADWAAAPAPAPAVADAAAAAAAAPPPPPAATNVSKTDQTYGHAAAAGTATLPLPPSAAAAPICSSLTAAAAALPVSRAHASVMSCHDPPRLSLASAPLAQLAQISAACCTVPQAWAALAPPTLSQAAAAHGTLPVPAVARAVPPSAAAPPIALASAFLLQRQDAPASRPAAPGPLQAAAGSSPPVMVRPHASGPAAAPFHKAFAQAHAMIEELRGYR